MISYFGSICWGDGDMPSSEFRWDGAQDLGSNLNRLNCPYRQMKVLLDQSLAVAYYLKFMGPKCHEIVNDYIEELNNDITYRFARACRNGRIFEGNFLKIYQILQSLVKFNRGGNWTKIDVALVKEFLFDGDERNGQPLAMHKNYIVPFMMWMNGDGADTYTCPSPNERTGVCSFSVDSSCRSKKLIVYVCRHAIGLECSARSTPIDSLTAVPLLGFMSHFNWSSTSFESFVGIVSEFCMHTDIERYGLTGTHHLAYCFRVGVIFDRMFDVSGCHEGVFPRNSPYKDRIFPGVLDFLKFCSEHRGMDVVDRNIVAKAFGVIASTKEQKESADYLAKQDATASADEFNSFRHTMGSCESLQLISQSPTLVAAQTSSQATGSTEAATQGGDDKQDTDAGKPAEPKETEPKTEEEPSEGDASDKPDSEQDLGPDDTSAEEADTPGSTDAGGDDGTGSSEPSTTDPSSTQPASAPAEPNTSDDKGIEFVITPPDSSTVDAVLFREEMYKFLTNVLTNPPKCLSPQDIATLTALKRFWLSSLSIETIKGIVEACIRLPKSIKNSIHKSTELEK